MGKTYFNYKFPKQTFQSKYSDNKQIVKNPLKVPELDLIQITIIFILLKT